MCTGTAADNDPKAWCPLTKHGSDDPQRKTTHHFALARDDDNSGLIKRPMKASNDFSEKLR